MNQRPVLLECYAGLVELTQEISAGAWDRRDAESLADACEDSFQEVEALAPMAEIPQAHLQLGKYAICALLDELILARGGNLAQRWSAQPLQLRYFNDFNAGDEFYNKLESIRHARDERQLQVVAVFHLCLCLGFCGRLADRRGQERRRALMDNLATELAAALPQGQSAAADDLRPLTAERWWQRLPAWSWPLLALVVVLLIALLLHRALSHDLAQLAEQMGAG